MLALKILRNLLFMLFISTVKEKYGLVAEVMLLNALMELLINLREILDRLMYSMVRCL